MSNHSSRPSFTVRSESDVLAMIPVALGFHPRDSLVMVSLGAGGRPLHARTDLPDEADDVGPTVDQLVDAAVRNRGRQALLVAYSADPRAAASAGLALRDGLVVAGIDVALMIRADGRRWYPLAGPGPVAGVPYDLSSHPFTANAVLEGRVTLRDREELVDSLAPLDPDRVEAVAAAHEALGGLDPADCRSLALEARWLVQEVRAAVRAPEDTGPASGVVPAPPERSARLLRAVAEHELRDLAWCEVTTESASRHVSLWREVVRESPGELVAPAAGLLAFAAWLSGDGALAWCAVERALGADPDHTLARLVAQVLEAAVPPSSWRPMDPDSLALSGG
jgi:hypothetical protein